MKRFVFTLATLDKVKKAREKEAQAELAAIRHRLAVLVGEEQRAQNRYVEAQNEYLAKLAGGVSVIDMRTYASFFEYLRAELKRLAQEIEIVNRELRACQEKLVGIMRELKMLEKLRERQYQRYLQEVQKDEDKQIDDFVTFQVSDAAR